MRVTYLEPGQEPATPGRVVLVRRILQGDAGCRLRGNNLAGAERVLFLAPPSQAGLADAITRASHYADGCGIREVFVREA
jgi:hypothetical protein